jgi:adenylate cyclase
MKRSVLPALIIGVIVSGLVLWLHVSGLALRLELPVSGFFSHSNTVTRVVSEKLQYLLVLVLAIGTAWIMLETVRRSRLAIVIAALAVELLAVTWVCALYGVFFQPLPSMSSALLALGAAAGYAAMAERRAQRPAVVFEDRLSEQQIDLIESGEVPVKAEAKIYDVSVVVCDIGNKYDLADDCEPAQCAEIITRFLASATKTFLDAGAYIEAAAGEGIVAIFGYPAETADHAEKATREAMKLTESFQTGQNGDAPVPEITIHAGVSTGRIIVAPFKSEDRAGTLATGEPVELARRFCIANRFYGSHVLIGPRTFELAGQAFVARPIDFLSGVDVRERHEIYEPISLAEHASPDAVQRRDSFWNGVVLYREKRWAEAYAHFQKARSPDHAEDPPLQLYLRRLEPLALQLTTTLLDE